MAIRKSTLLDGAPKAPTPPTAHPHMRHVPGGNVAIPSRGKALAPASINPGCRDRNADSAAGTVTPAAIVDRNAPGAVKSRRV